MREVEALRDGCETAGRVGTSDVRLRPRVEDRRHEHERRHDADGEAREDDDAAAVVEGTSLTHGSLEELEAERCEARRDEGGNRHGRDRAELELRRDDEHDRPMPEVRPVGDLAQIDDGSAREEALYAAAVRGLDRQDQQHRHRRHCDASLDWIEVDPRRGEHEQGGHAHENE